MPVRGTNVSPSGTFVAPRRQRQFRTPLPTQPPLTSAGAAGARQAPPEPSGRYRTATTSASSDPRAWRLEHALGLLGRRDARLQRGAEVRGDAVGRHHHAVAGPERRAHQPYGGQRPAEHAAEQGGGVGRSRPRAAGAHEPALDVADPGPASARPRSRSNQASVATTPRVRAARRGSAASSAPAARRACSRRTPRRPRRRRPPRRRARGRRSPPTSAPPVVRREHREVAGAALARERRARDAALERGGPAAPQARTPGRVAPT